MSQITRCPACGTMFKVVPDQLRISEGWVRCGHCTEVFDATTSLQDKENAPALGTPPVEAQLAAAHATAPAVESLIPGAVPDPSPKIGAQAAPPAPVAWHEPPGLGRTPGDPPLLSRPSALEHDDEDAARDEEPSRYDDAAADTDLQDLSFV